MKHTLEHHKLKKTTTRQLVLDILGDAKKPLSVDDIFIYTKKIKRQSGIKQPDLVTIYRTVETFAHAGIVKEVLFKDRTVRYEIVDEHGGHCHHAVCSFCGTTEHVDDPAIENALHVLTKKFKHIKNVNEHVLEFFGVCTSCVKTNRKK